MQNIGTPMLYFINKYIIKLFIVLSFISHLVKKNRSRPRFLLSFFYEFNILWGTKQE